MKAHTGYSCPYEPFDEHFNTSLTTLHARAVGGEFLRRYGRDLARSSTGLVAMIEAGLDKARAFETVWGSNFGAALAAMLAPARDPTPCAVGLALRLSLAGAMGSWQARLATPVRVRVGPWLIPAGRKIACTAAATSITLETDDQGARVTRVFRRHNERWTARNVPALRSLSVASHELHVMSKGALLSHEREWASSLAQSRVTGSAVAAMRIAIRHLERYSPEYAAWVARTARCLIPWRPAGGIQRSGSSEHSPGVIGISTRHEPCAVAQMLVHEATHQYMYVLTRLGTLDDGSDRKLYYSPVRGMDRPIGAIVIAYHAAANEMLFFRSCKRNGLDVEYLDRMETVREPQLRAMEAVLSSTRALTPLGQALVTPLMRRVGSLEAARR